jgi:hypothetical protein
MEIVEEENKRLHHVEKICRAKSTNVINFFDVDDVTRLFLLLGYVLHFNIILCTSKVWIAS